MSPPTPSIKKETVEPYLAGLVQEFTEPSAFIARGWNPPSGVIAVGQGASADARSANRFMFEAVYGNCRSMVAPFTVNCMTMAEDGAAGACVEGRTGAGTATLICDAET